MPNGIGFQYFPKNRTIAKKWCQVINRVELMDIPVNEFSKLYICGQHFNVSQLNKKTKIVKYRELPLMNLELLQGPDSIDDLVKTETSETVDGTPIDSTKLPTEEPELEPSKEMNNSNQLGLEFYDVFGNVDLDLNKTLNDLESFFNPSDPTDLLNDNYLTNRTAIDKESSIKIDQVDHEVSNDNSKGEKIHLIVILKVIYDSYFNHLEDEEQRHFINQVIQQVEELNVLTKDNEIRVKILFKNI
ncbi:unnamed protein product [Diamesa serratosioi]